MKKILTIILLTITFSVFAQEKVPSIWAFNIANIQGSYFREILDEANKIQSKYQFFPEHRPGAGGSIAAAHVLNQENLALLGTAAGFFVRPYLYSNTPYDFNQFRPLHVMAVSPAALVSKDKELKDILSKQIIKIGTAGSGSLTHLMALKFKDQLVDKTVIIVPYKSSTEALQDVLGGHIDLTFEFLGDAESKGAKILGLTGRNKVKDYPLLKDLGYYTQADLVGIYLILVKKDISNLQVEELRKIFKEAEKSTRVQSLYEKDYSSKLVNIQSESEYKIWYQQTINFYRELTYGQKVE
jgi:tripartite-type tricarboxylate transporter receptor subunit TctC